MAVSVKNIDVDGERRQTSFSIVFDEDRNVLLDETEVPGAKMYEGVAFANDDFRRCSTTFTFCIHVETCNFELPTSNWDQCKHFTPCYGQRMKQWMYRRLIDKT